MKTKKCRNPECKKEFMPSPQNPLQPTCFNSACIVWWYEKEKKRKWAKEKNRRLDNLKSLSEWLKTTEKNCNAFIRERDKREPCISCGCWYSDLNILTAGHYLSVGSCPELRFNEMNINSQCLQCNSYKAGNGLEYQKGLIKKYGTEKVLWLDGPHETRQWRIPEVRELNKYFLKKIKELKKGVDIGVDSW